MSTSTGRHVKRQTRHKSKVGLVVTAALIGLCAVIYVATNWKTALTVIGLAKNAEDADISPVEVKLGEAFTITGAKDDSDETMRDVSGAVSWVGPMTFTVSDVGYFATPAEAGFTPKTNDDPDIATNPSMNPSTFGVVRVKLTVTNNGATGKKKIVPSGAEVFSLTEFSLVPEGNSDELSCELEYQSGNDGVNTGYSAEKGWSYAWVAPGQTKEFLLGYTVIRHAAFKNAEGKSIIDKNGYEKMGSVDAAKESREYHLLYLPSCYVTGRPIINLGTLP